MKAPKNGTHPCPILLETDESDYLNSCSISREVTALSGTSPASFDSVSRFQVKVDLSCSPLEALIQEGKAKLAVLVEQTTLRKCLDCLDGTVNVELKPYSLRSGDNVIITPLVVATKPGELDYSPDYMDPIYGAFSTQSFSFEEGQILAVGEEKILETTKIKDVSSIVAIQSVEKFDDKKRPFDFEFSHDQIHVLMPKSEKKQIDEAAAYNGGIYSFIVSTFAYPAIQQAVVLLKTKGEDYSHCQWATALKNTLERRAPVDFRDFLEEPKYETSEMFQKAWNLAEIALSNKKGTQFESGFNTMSEND